MSALSVGKGTGKGGIAGTLCCFWRKNTRIRRRSFVAHQEVLEDEEMTEETENVIKEDCLTAESAVDTIFNQYADLLKQVEDP